MRVSFAFFLQIVAIHSATVQAGTIPLEEVHQYDRWKQEWHRKWQEDPHPETDEGRQRVRERESWNFRYSDLVGRVAEELGVNTNHPNRSLTHMPVRGWTFSLDSLVQVHDFREGSAKNLTGVLAGITTSGIALVARYKFTHYGYDVYDAKNIIRPNLSGSDVGKLVTDTVLGKVYRVYGTLGSDSNLEFLVVGIDETINEDGLLSGESDYGFVPANEVLVGNLDVNSRIEGELTEDCASRLATSPPELGRAIPGSSYPR